MYFSSKMLAVFKIVDIHIQRKPRVTILLGICRENKGKFCSAHDASQLQSSSQVFSSGLISASLRTTQCPSC